MDIKELAKKWDELTHKTFEEFSETDLKTVKGDPPGCFGDGAPYAWCYTCPHRTKC
ncbi:hypothetical protein KAR48_13045 [bacterium]|nr:hypothetical protein [bacterium]